MSIAILGIIMVPLSGLVFAYLHNTDATNARLLETHDVQITSDYFAQDVASIGTRNTATPPALNQSIELNVAYNAGLFPCGPAGTPSAIVRFAWDDFATATSGATQIRVAYVVRTVGSETQLHRLVCSGSAALTSDAVLAHRVVALTPPTVTCSSSCTGSGTSVPSKVTMTLTVKDPRNPLAPYIVVLTGQRRQS